MVEQVMQQAETSTMTAEHLQIAHDKVFRSSTDQPGYHYEDLGPDLDSHSFRQIMVDVMKGLIELNEQRNRGSLKIQWIGRFNHRHTSRFHRDNADPHSFLILGYEPTEIDSQVAVADYAKFIETNDLSVDAYFGHPQVNTAPNDGDLSSVTTVLSPFQKSNYQLLILNNSKSSEEPALGMFHRGIVTESPLESEPSHDRIINSMMLYADNNTGSAQPSDEAIADFVATNKVDR